MALVREKIRKAKKKEDVSVLIAMPTEKLSKLTVKAKIIYEMVVCRKLEISSLRLLYISIAR